MEDALYDDIRRRVGALAAEVGDAMELPVPACPGWTGREVVAHLAGLAEDLVEGHRDGYGSDRWTAAQVTRFADMQLNQVLERWDLAAQRLGDAEPLGGVPAAAMAFGDAIVHEADLRGAVAPGSRPPAAAVAAGVKAGVSRWRPVLEHAAAPTLRIDVIGQREYVLGREPTPSTVLHADQYELFRTLFGRRSREQVRALEWDGDCRPYLDAGLPHPFRWAELDIVD